MKKLGLLVFFILLLSTVVYSQALTSEISGNDSEAENTTENETGPLPELISADEDIAAQIDDLIQQETVPPPPPQPKSNTGKLIFGILIMVIGLGAIGYVVWKMMKPKKVVTQQQLQQQPQIKQDPLQVQLQNYIKQNMAQGYTKEQIIQTLRQSGYSPQAIDEAMKNV